MTDPKPNALDPKLQIVVDDIRKYRCHILHVVEEGELPPYSYSIGLNRTMKVPDAVVIGLNKDIAHALINCYRNQRMLGRRYAGGDRVEGYIEEFPVEIRNVHPSHYAEWFQWSVALYRTGDFRMQQIVYPSVDGSWPWERQVDPWFRRRQPVLDRMATKKGDG